MASASTWEASPLWIDDELRGAFGELLDELSNQYLLGYVPAAAHRDDAWHSIKVEVEGHSEIRARQGYRREPSK